MRRIGELAEGRQVSQPDHETAHHAPDCVRGDSHVVRWLFASVGCNAAYAADLMAAVTKAVATGQVTPGEAAEIGRVIDAYVRAYQTAELHERVVRADQLSDAELMRIAMASRQTDVTSAPQSPKLLILNPR